MRRFLTIFFIFVAFYLSSEVIVLNNGDIIRGKLIKMDEDTMTILAKYGELVIDRDDIDQIYKDEESYKKKQTASKSNTSETEKKDGNEMVLIKGGTFIMGDTFGGGKPDEKPVHNVTLDDFYISKYEVSFEEFDKYCDDIGAKRKSEGGYFNDKRFGERSFKRPVWEVSWYDAIEYCNWLSKKEGLTPCYTISKEGKDPNNKSVRDKVKWKVECNFNANGYRLPTEAEWEYAARGGNKSKGLKYSGSNSVEDYAIFGVLAGHVGSGRSYSFIAAIVTYNVGSKKPNELGLYDMSGHVWEWCWDWYDKDYYKNNSNENPLGPEVGKSRVLRGGSWNNEAFLLRISNRKEAIQNDDYDWTTGFRIVRSAK